MKTKIEKRVSEKTGKEYYVLLVELVPGYEKQVFLDKADLKIIELSNNKTN